MQIQDVQMLFQFVGGLGMFLYGMNIMAEGLKQSAGGRMKSFLAVLTSNRILGVLMGALITAIIQSSSATTVMVVGFVNAGIIDLTQAVGVIMGANIGTTVTAWLVSMSEWGAVAKPEFFAPVLVGVGAFFIIFTQAQKKKEAGEILLGFGILFIGLSFMSGSIEPYKDAPIFSEVFRVLGSNPILGILAGAAVTAVIQSSSASVGILQTLAMNGIVNWNSAIFITLGQNIGTCVTAIIASAGANRTAKRAATIHLLFNVIGAVIFGILMTIVFIVFPQWGSSTINSVEISAFHTVFNVANTILLFPFAKVLVRMSERLLPNKGERKEMEDKEAILTLAAAHLDRRIMESPGFAIEAAVQEVLVMGDLAAKNVEDAVNAAINNEQDAVDRVMETEETLDELDRLLTEYLIKIHNLPLTQEQNVTMKNLLYMVSDLERVGDHAENIAELAKRIIDEKMEFSEYAKEDLLKISDKVKKALSEALKSRKNMSPEAVRQVIKLEDDVDNMEEEMREDHIARLSNGACKPATGVIFLDIISNLERISDHADNIAGYVKNEL